MGKYTNTSNIFQIGKNNKHYIWNSKYFEKTLKDSQTLIYKSLEIKKFIEKFLLTYGLMLNKFNINFKEHSIEIFISYIKLLKSNFYINKINKDQNVEIKKSKKKRFHFYKKKNNKVKYCNKTNKQIISIKKKEKKNYNE